MPDLRYHLISLISVFLALAIGILLGVAVADEGVVTDRLEAEISDVQQRFGAQQEEIGERDRQIELLRERTATDENVQEAMSETMNSDRLLGVEVALVSGPYAEAETVEGVESALALAGASLTSVETLDAPSSVEEVTTGAESTTPLQGDYASLAYSVLDETGGEAVPPQAVVFVGGGELPPNSPNGTLAALNEAQATIFDIWQDSGVRVVAAESEDSGRSEIESFQSAGLASVDNADTPAGRAAIVQLLAYSDEEGSFGTKDTASDLFPPPPDD